ncbi:hypothetical protein ACFQPF_05445 [Fictibacillus iocasae]|uniref:Lipoprotein n=1 Tax=Fictibacillus iocasae TaxID=2715437 RepID=A0ABW2NP89_9BACL
MKKVWLGMMAAGLLVLAGCLSDPVAEEMVTYVNKTMKPLSEQEEEVKELYEGVTGNNYTDDQTLYTALTEEIIPKYNEFLKDVESIELETEEMQELHEKYIEAVQIQQNGMLSLVTALEEQSFEKVNEANGKLNEARKMMRDYQKDIKKLADEHEVTFEKEK